MNLGAGRVVYQSLTRIDQDIADGGFFKNPVLCAGVEKTIDNNSALHVFGLLSPGGIHSHENQIMAMLELAVMKAPPKSTCKPFSMVVTRLRVARCLPWRGQISF